ncbi:undecaprenyl-diphosphatase UppP [uncultured Campylobacter sp.]|uniref:undecaprenyl-diphosphatase UppP n=1 Tax=uncultured Campylobacter sp. TaxID=218934 RepID=UPI00262FD38E|nr:undecaprenyl-diphosphatase UppP [uncultured Campylobacter sp.]
MNFFDAIILGIVEGLTEFLPVSSTGHIILAANLMGLDQESPLLKSFQVVIQLGSILAVLVLFFERLRQNFSLWIKLAIGFLPTAIIGFLLYKTIKSIFDPSVTAYMLIFYGFIFIIVELFIGKKDDYAKTKDIDSISYKQAFIIGLSQCLAMVPGTSRSGITIITALLCGLDRRVAAIFSFLLALPTMFAAAIYDSYKNISLFKENIENIYLFLTGSAVAFVVAFFTVKLFISFISKFNYIPFGIYRIILGTLFIFFIL